jgi:methylated-DNA-[protein]-cysteine S-methyltransferase
MGVVENGAGLVEVRVGEPTVESLRESLLARYIGARIGSGSSVTELLDQYCHGRVVSFSDVALAERPMGDFHRRVLEACRGIEYGQTSSYGKLAARAGRPGAARAVGAAMARNPWPIVVPCHRVLRGGGALGGYSAPAGLALKQALLDLEAQQLASTRPPADER